jgi:hypothetical protein
MLYARIEHPHHALDLNRPAPAAGRPGRAGQAPAWCGARTTLRIGGRSDETASVLATRPGRAATTALAAQKCFLVTRAESSKNSFLPSLRKRKTRKIPKSAKKEFCRNLSGKCQVQIDSKSSAVFSEEPCSVV